MPGGTIELANLVKSAYLRTCDDFENAFKARNDVKLRKHMNEKN